MNGVTIGCFYSCEGCGLKNARVEVPARVNEDVRVWMDATIRVLARDHGRRSPTCHPTSLQEVKIPITGATKVGGPSIS